MQDLIEPLAFLKEIHDEGVKYLLIGRQAVIAYGGPVQSMDYDIYVDGSPENTDKLLAIAQKYELYPSIPKEKLHENFKFRLENDIAVDIFRAKSFSSGKGKKITFQEIYERKNTLKDFSGLEINVPSIDDLIALKRLRSSPKDLNDIKYLQAIKKENK